MVFKLQLETDQGLSFAWSNWSDQYFESKNDGFMKGDHLNTVGSDLIKRNFGIKFER